MAFSRYGASAAARGKALQPPALQSLRPREQRAALCLASCPRSGSPPSAVFAPAPCGPSPARAPRSPRPSGSPRASSRQPPGEQQQRGASPYSAGRREPRSTKPRPAGPAESGASLSPGSGSKRAQTRSLLQSSPGTRGAAQSPRPFSGAARCVAFAFVWRLALEEADHEAAAFGPDVGVAARVLDHRPARVHVRHGLGEQVVVLRGLVRHADPVLLSELPRPHPRAVHHEVAVHHRREALRRKPLRTLTARLFVKRNSETLLPAAGLPTCPGSPASGAEFCELHGPGVPAEKRFSRARRETQSQRRELTLSGPGRRSSPPR